MLLQREEKGLIGAWVSQDGKIIKDQVCERIEWLISSHLIRIASDGTGWDILYQDPNDNRYWELYYPHGEMHGGGPPSLINLSLEEARGKYNIAT